jgi:hypothetical protein
MLRRTRNGGHWWAVSQFQRLTIRENLLALVQGCKQQEKGSKNDPVIDTESVQGL